MEQQESIQFTDFGRILWNRRKIFVLTGFVSGILGVLISFILPVYYQSSATIFPAAISYVESTDLVYRRGNKIGRASCRERVEIAGGVDGRIVKQRDQNMTI